MKRGFQITALLVLIAAAAAFTIYARNDPHYLERPSVENFSLLDARGNAFELYRHSEAKAIVLIAHGLGCPMIAKRYPDLARLRDTYGPKGVEFLFINASPQDSRAAIAAEAEKFGIQIPVLKDESQMITKGLGLTRTTEAIVIVPKIWRQVFRGAIDDRLDYTAERAEPKERYLTDAIEAVLHQRALAVANTATKGCLIPQPDAGSSLTYTKDVAPIIAGKCLGCHALGRIAPTNFNSYDGLRDWSAMIRETVRTARMPPVLLDPEFGKLRSEVPALSPGDQRTLLSWIESEQKRGEGPDTLSTWIPPAQDDDKAGAPDLVLTSVPDSIPATGTLDYRYRQLGPPTDRDLWVTALAIRHEEPDLSHHVALVVLDRPLADYADENGSMNFPDMSRFTTKAVVFANGNRLDSIRRFPKGTAMFVPKGSVLALQLHYHTIGRPVTVTPKVSLWLAKRGGHLKKLQFGILQKLRFLIPANTKEVLTENLVLDKDIVLVKLAAHMHFRGTAIRLVAHLPGGNDEVLFSIPRFDATARQSFSLAEPKPLPAGTRLEAIAAYDNTGENPANPDPSVDVSSGPFAEKNEMMKVFFTYYLR